MRGKVFLLKKLEKKQQEFHGKKVKMPAAFYCEFLEILTFFC